MAEPLTLRYNNPGAVEFKPWMSQYGARLGPNGRYAQFDSPDQGYQVMGRVLDTYRDKHGLNTVSGIINRWAPANVDNNSTSSYAASVAKSLGIDPNAPLTPEQRPSLMRAMASYEAGRAPAALPAPMPLGNPPAQAAPAPAPTGAPPMADPYRPQPRGGFLGLIDALQGGMGSPLFQSGAAMYSAASQGKDIGTGFMMGGEAAGRAAKSQADQARMQRETMAQQQRDQMWQQLTSGQTPAWASNLPAGTLDLARALGPDAGATLISQMIGKTVDNYAAGDGFLYNKRTGETKALPADLKRPEDAKTSLQPMYGVDKDGNPVVLQTRSDGSVVQSKMPEGVTVARQPIKMDAGTHFVMLDPVTRQQIGIVPKDLEGKAVAEAAGEARGKAIVDLPRVEGLAQRITKQVEDLEKDKRLPNILGLAARLPTFLPANVATEERAKQLSGAAFLQAFESLKGAGAITEAEGEKATVALARLSNLRQDEAGYRQALSEFKAEVKRMLEMARERAKGGKPLPSAGGRGAPSGAGWSIERAD